MSEAAFRVVMTLAFYPRGGSAQVARYLGRALGGHGVDVTLCCGSLGFPGSNSHAQTFFAGLDVHELDFTDAVARFERGEDPMAAPVPMQPSFEDRPDVPDRVFASLDQAAYRRQVAAWRGLLERVDPPDLYHIHHLTHVNDAVMALGETRVVVHLHGTELKMLDAIRHGAADSWPFALAWQHRLQAAAQRASRLVTVSSTDRDLASELLAVDSDSIDVVPNGVDIGRFSADRLPPEEQQAFWRRWLVEDPQGWDETGEAGSVRYSVCDLQQGFLHPLTGEPLPVMLFVGRFLGFKRVPLLVRAYAMARSVLGASAPPLVIWGGYPGEWEGEHPHSVVESLGVDGVFFAGWRGHDDLSVALNCADVFVAPSVDEPFGQVYLEAMAAGLPVIATRSGGPPSFVSTEPARPSGWLVTPDAEHELADTIVTAAKSATERQRRGRQGREIVERDFDWRQIARRFESIYYEAARTP
ncbi:MAG: glycosyltransferase family 4 protein [Acidimicrobiia bacterium]|nr:glycosyltransferase family 4 protein [Acidimicrobiia bacterium]